MPICQAPISYHQNKIKDFGQPQFLEAYFTLGGYVHWHVHNNPMHTSDAKHKSTRVAWYKHGHRLTNHIHILKVNVLMQIGQCVRLPMIYIHQNMHKYA